MHIEQPTMRSPPKAIFARWGKRCVYRGQLAGYHHRVDCHVFKPVARFNTVQSHLSVFLDGLRDPLIFRGTAQ